MTEYRTRDRVRSKFIGGAAAARIGRLIGLEVDAATAELIDGGKWEYSISAYASETWAEVSVYYCTNGIPVAGELVRAYPRERRKVIQLFFSGAGAPCVDTVWDPNLDVYEASEETEPFMPEDCGARIRQARDEFMAELARMEKEGEHSE